MSQHSIFAAILTIAATTGLAIVPQAAHAEMTSSQSASSYSGSLSVTGTSQLNVPADQATVVLLYSPNSYSSDSSSQSPVVQPSDLKTVVNAVTNTGVAAANAQAFADPSSPGSMRVWVVLNQPNQAKINQIIDTANTAATKTNRYLASSASVGYTVKDCGAAEAQARQAAMTDAQNRAVALAKAAGAQVGRASSLSESVSWNSGYSSSCPVSNDPTAFGYYSLPPYDPSQPAVVKLIYSLSASYDMR